MSAYDDFLAARADHGMPSRFPEGITIPDEGPLPETLHRIDRAAANTTNHRWRQQGGPGMPVICRSCDLEHGFNTNPGDLLTGIDDNGYPVLKSISGKQRSVVPA